MNTTLKKLYRLLPNYSYTKFFLLKSPATKEQRQLAVKKYLDATRK